MSKNIEIEANSILDSEKSAELIKPLLKTYLKPFLIIFSIYCFSMLGFWRFGLSYIDDRAREAIGYGWNEDSRYLSTIISSLFIQASDSLVDISPIPQILAMGLLAIASLALVDIFGNIKKKSHLIYSTFLGLNPFTLQCWLYKFDAPCMALGLLFTIVPFFFLKRDRSDKWYFEKFWTASFICLLATLLTFQLFVCFYIIVLLSLLYRAFVKNDELRYHLRVFLYGAVAFVAIIASKNYIIGDYKHTLETSIGALLTNLQSVSLYIYNNLSFSWKALLVIIASFSLCLTIKKTAWQKKRSIAVLLLGLIYLVACYGSAVVIYAVTKKPPIIQPRYFPCLGGIMAIILISLNNSTSKEKVLSALNISSYYAFYLAIVFNFALSNTLKVQEDYADFRASELASTLISNFSTEELVGMNVIPFNDIGYPKTVQNTISTYPIIHSYLSPFNVGFSANPWGQRKMLYVFNLNIGLEPQYIIEGLPLREEPTQETAEKRISNLYEDIYIDDENIYIILK